MQRAHEHADQMIDSITDILDEADRQRFPDEESRVSDWTHFIETLGEYLDAVDTFMTELTGNHSDVLMGDRDLTMKTLTMTLKRLVLSNAINVLVPEDEGVGATTEELLGEEGP